MRGSKGLAFKPKYDKGWRLWVLVPVLLVLGACALPQQYRTDYTLCTSERPERECQQSALQAYRDTSGRGGDYLLGFIEFDDQGQLFDRAQMSGVIDALYRRVAPQNRDLLIVVFVHGWKHNAAAGDGNIATFRQALQQLSRAERLISRDSGVPPREVVGIYLGWRGASLTAPLLKQLTFWERKNTAHKVGRGGVTEVLNRLELLRLSKDAIAPGQQSRTRLIVVGHSFGGAVVYSALSQILEWRFIHTESGPATSGNIQGFGNLVVLINPAFEAIRYAPLRDMSTERGTYFDGQLPVLLVLTSEADAATKYAFPLGRGFSTMFEAERIMQRHNAATHSIEYIDQDAANITAIGHFAPYRTHYLRATAPEARAEQLVMSTQSAAQQFFRSSQRWEDDSPGSRIPFPGTVLERTMTSAGRNPYLIVQVDKAIIHDHNHLSDPRIMAFVNQLILIASQTQDVKLRSLERMKGLAK